MTTQFGDAARLGEFVVLRHVKGEAVGEDAAGVGQVHSAVAQSFGVQVVAAKSERLVPDGGSGELNGVFEIAVLGLKMVRPDVRRVKDFSSPPFQRLHRHRNAVDHLDTNCHHHNTSIDGWNRL